MSRPSLRSIGPAIIVASVVLGPGSILVSSRVGCDHGYDLLWIVALAAVLMIGMTALAARLGTQLDATPCEEIARRAGRPMAAFVGIVLFCVVACFQFSNNVAVIAALETFFGSAGESPWPMSVLVALNLGLALALFGTKRLYRPLEILMKVLVGAMILGFLGNLLFARPSLSGMLGGFVPKLPEGLEPSFLPARVEGSIVDSWLPLAALFGTTFSVAGAFYQAYLVRDRGWKSDDLGRGLTDSIVGISVLGLLTATILITAAAVLHGRVAGSELKSAADVALQLEPLFGSGAKLLFGLGLLAGAFSSFLVNAMIGGAVLSDGLGLGGRMDRVGPKICTLLALVAGLVVALAIRTSGFSPLELITFGQALTVLGNPVLAGVLLWFSREVGAPRWVRGLAFLGLIVALALAVRTGVTVFYKVT